MSTSFRMSRKCTRGVRHAAAILCASALLASEAVAQEKPLIEKWLDGEVKANFPKVTYDGVPITLRYSTFIPEFPIHVKAFKRLEADTNGKLIVRAYWGNTLANAQRGAFEAVSGGIADFGNCYVANSPGGFHLFHGLQLPFLFQTSAQASMAATEVYPRFLKKEYEAKGVYLARMTLPRPAQLLTSKAPVEKLEDLKGKKLVSLGSPLVNEILKALGGVPTVVAVPEAYTAFQTGVFDGAPIHDAALMFFRLHEIGKFHTKVDLFSQSLEYCVNAKRYDELPADLKAIFYHWNQLLNLADAILFYDAMADRAAALFEQRGIKMIKLPAEEQARWKAAVDPVVAAFVKSHESRGSAEFVAALREQAARYAKQSADEITRQTLEKPLPGLIGN